jgi:hypothetical protein
MAVITPLPLCQRLVTGRLYFNQREAWGMTEVAHPVKTAAK